MGDETPHDGWPCLRCWTGYIGVPESSNCVRLLAGRTCWDAALRAAAHGGAFFSDRVSQARMRLVGQLYSVLFRRVYVCVASLANGAGERLDTRLPFVLGDIDELNRQLDWCVVFVCLCVLCLCSLASCVAHGIGTTPRHSHIPRLQKSIQEAAWEPCHWFGRHRFELGQRRKLVEMLPILQIMLAVRWLQADFSRL